MHTDIVQTCSHPPGAAQRSMRALQFPRMSYFLFSCINLKAARERYLHACNHSLTTSV